jgi:hypothetical protein
MRRSNGWRVTLAAMAIGTFSSSIHAEEKLDRWAQLDRTLTAYRNALKAVRQSYGGSRHIPSVRFFLFGMGGRQKLVYRDGALYEARTGAVMHRWELVRDLIVPPAYTVAIETKNGMRIFIVEDEEGVWLEEGGKRTALSSTRIRLPGFAGHRSAPALKVLHQELLINVVDGKPVPNLFVYRRPWYRDAAMMCMAFARTHNLDLVRDWILRLREPYDRNNNGELEADNLGQVLYLVSLVSDRSHPLVAAVQKELKHFEKGGHIEGRSDFAPHPAYQTKWAKFGLAALGLDDPYAVPQGEDSYSSLFWWKYKERGVQAVRDDENYPYLTWAAAHSAGLKRGRLSDQDYPLTWEARASQADYQGMKTISPAFCEQRMCVPHAWHAAEAFLYLLEEKE